MDLTPKTVTIAVPINVPELRGRHATTKPYGSVQSIRINNATLAEVDLAISRINPSPTRSIFMRQVVVNAARAVNEGYEELQRQSKELDDGLSELRASNDLGSETRASD